MQEFSRIQELDFIVRAKIVHSPARVLSNDIGNRPQIDGQDSVHQISELLFRHHTGIDKIREVILSVDQEAFRLPNLLQDGGTEFGTKRRPEQLLREMIVRIVRGVFIHRAAGRAFGDSTPE
jgi:hypothetical protein